MEERISQEWHLRGFTCDIWIDKPGKRWEDYIHNQDELFMLLEGSVELEIDGKICRPEINQVVHIPAHTVHSVRNIGTRPAKWLYGYRQENVNEEDIKDFNQ